MRLAVALSPHTYDRLLQHGFLRLGAGKNVLGKDEEVKEVWAMKFLVIWKSFETITQEQAGPLRAEAAEGLEQLSASPKVKDIGGFDDERGLYMILGQLST
jgi:hypothetical protein